MPDAAKNLFTGRKFDIVLSVTVLIIFHCANRSGFFKFVGFSSFLEIPQNPLIKLL